MQRWCYKVSYMNKISLKNLCKASFNAANLNGLGAIALSIGLGNAVGTSIFAGAVVLGTVNKYMSLQKDEIQALDQDQNIVLKMLNEPTVTAKALMVAAGFNCAESGYDALLSEGNEQLQHVFASLAWGSGVLGDNALRRLDKLNFTDYVDVKKGVSKVKDSFNAVVSNPVIFYNATAMGFSASMMLNEKAGALENIVGYGTMSAATTAILYSVYRAVDVVRKNGNVADINDGVTNTISALVPLGVGGLGLVSGKEIVAVAQAIFGGSAIKSLYETRAALAKESDKPNQENKIG